MGFELQEKGLLNRRANAGRNTRLELREKTDLSYISAVVLRCVWFEDAGLVLLGLVPSSLELF